MAKLLNSKPVPGAGVIFNRIFTKTRHCYVWGQVELLLVYICALNNSKLSLLLAVCHLDEFQNDF